MGDRTVAWNPNPPFPHDFSAANKAVFDQTQKIFEIISENFENPHGVNKQGKLKYIKI